MGEPMLRYLPYLLLVTLWIYAFVDCLVTPDRQVRGLPKLVWLVIILFFGEIMIGPLAWLLVGKRRTAAAYPQSAYRVAPRPADAAPAGPAAQEQDGPPREFVPPDDNPEFLRSLSELIQRQRKDGPTPTESD
ncbi:PLD nuclease N-terminal domain-containing protein [Streptomyces sp. DvalAA-14]|nr:PLD nuclease N-terminal domain-containing protein [Streptomyces sp. DvalAA-14]